MRAQARIIGVLAILLVTTGRCPGQADCSTQTKPLDCKEYCKGRHNHCLQNCNKMKSSRGGCNQNRQQASAKPAGTPTQQRGNRPERGTHH